MYAILIVVLFSSLFFGLNAITTPKEQSFAIEAKSDVQATNYIAYRKAVVKYIQANPSATGVISDGLLTAYYLPGYIKDPKWRNIVSGGTVYIYTTSTISTNMMYDVFNKSSNSLLVGKKNSTTGRLQSINGFDTGITLPSAIPNNSLVIIGT